MTNVVVSDTTPLQYLHQSRTLDLLPKLFDRVICAASGDRRTG